MKLSLLPLPILAVTVLTVPEVRAEFKPSIVSSDARWVAYADLNALRQNPAGKEAIDAFQKQGASHAFPLPGVTLTVDVPKLLATVGSVTAYGANFEKNAKQVDGTLVIQGTPDLRKILEAVVLEVEVGNASAVHDVKGLGYSAYAFEALNKQHPEMNHEVIIGFPCDGMVIVGQSEDKVRQAYDLTQGRGASLLQAKGSDLAALAGNADHATIFAASVVPPDVVAAAAKGPAGPHLRILEMTHSASVAIGDQDGKTFAHAQLVAADGESADKLTKILQGMVAMLSLTQSNDQKLTDFINSAQASRDGNHVTLQLAYDSTQLATMVQTLLNSAENAHRGVAAGHGPQNVLERSLGKRLSHWQFATVAAGEAPATAPQWKEIADVKLTNGAQVTLHQHASGTNGIALFDEVQVKPPAGDGAPLTFSRKMMSENRRLPAGPAGRLLQFGFPGEDGTYTLRVRVTPPAQGSATLDVWVKNDSDSDNRAGAAPQS